MIAAPREAFLKSARLKQKMAKESSDCLRVQELNTYLQKNYSHITLTNIYRDKETGDVTRLILAGFQISALVALIDFEEPVAGTNRMVSGNHLEFVYKGVPKTTFTNIWKPREFYIYSFKPE